MNQDIELRHLRALVALAQEGGVGRASRALGVSQSTISEHLFALERALEVKLTLRRRGQEMGLSGAGEAWLPHAVRVLREVESAIAAVQGRKLRVLRVGATESLNSFVLPRVLKALRVRWPELEVEVSTGLCDGLRAGVRADAFELALTLNADDGAGGTLVDDVLEVRRLAPASIALLARAEDPLGTDRPTRRTELVDRMLLVPDPEGQFHRCLETYLQGLGDVRLRSAGTIGGVKTGVAVGQGLGVLPAFAAEAELRQKDLRQITLEPPIPPMMIEAATLARVGRSPPLQDLMDLLSEALGGDPALGSRPPGP